jgi:hypothetical protein
MFSLEEGLLLEGCIELTMNSWKRWIQEDEIPEGWSSDNALTMIASLGTLKGKISSINETFEEPGLTEEDLDEIENILLEEEMLPQNVLLFPTPEA